ncbi:hypothetical protein KAR91_48395 [Candidatus Pacearchaeota archaeon]|nr:hypothetical protein [Candidatus Pacearchaeota archaeon]
MTDKDKQLLIKVIFERMDSTDLRVEKRFNQTDMKIDGLLELKFKLGGIVIALSAITTLVTPLLLKAGPKIATFLSTII